MSLIQELEQIVQTVIPTDPSFGNIERDELDHLVFDARQAALANSRDEFLLSLMRLLARPRNGHTRLIPNAAISVVPLRFATIGTAIRLLGAPSGDSEAIGSELLSVNETPVSEIEAGAEQYLAGTRQRQRVIGPILFTWPAALQHLGVPIDGKTITYQVRTATGQIRDLPMDATQLVSGASLYPQSEHGKADAAWSPEIYLNVKDFGASGLFLSLPSFFDPGKTALPDAISKAAERASARPDIPLLIDVRGNTGGDFLKTLPLIDAISQSNENRRVGVLVDKFTFSAAIVFVAILKHRLQTRLVLIGEEMGDGLTFFAEGGSIGLSTSEAIVRYSSAFHDWAGGRIDHTTPTEIAEQIVPVGSLDLDRFWVAGSAGSLTCRIGVAKTSSKA